MSLSGNEELVRYLKRRGLIVTEEVERAFREVDRAHFTSGSPLIGSYGDHPLPIGEGQTISAPHMVAIMAEALRCEPGNRVLEIGTGSGYHAAVVSRLVSPGGHVYTVERISSLVKKAQRNIDMAGIGNIIVVGGDGSRGLVEHSPYDRIYYTCAAPKVPDMVIKQLAEGGILLAVVGPKRGAQMLERYHKGSGGVTKEDLTGCVFVPLIGEYGY